jgi:N-methylhydantoinase B
MTMTSTHSTTQQTRLRDLSSEEFIARYHTDQFGCTVLKNRLRYVLEHVCSQLLTNAFSPVLRDFYDFSACISAPPEMGYAVPAVADTIPVFYGSMRDAIANSVEVYGVENFGPGDVIFSNDPFRNGTHVNDVCFIRPVFYEGRLVSFVTLRVHVLDMGGVTPGGFSGTETNVYETGIVIPPLPIFQADRSNEGLVRLFFDNVRFGDVMLPDLETIHAALQMGESLLQAIEKYGLDAYHGSMRYVCDASAEGMRRAIEVLPDGVYRGSDALDCDGIDDSQAYRVELSLTKKGHSLEFDLSGTSHQARTALNCTWPDIKNALSVALKLVLDPHSAFTSACLRDVDVVVPMGTLVTATPPDGAVFSFWEGLGIVLAAAMEALNALVGPRGVATDGRANWIHNASGRWPDGRAWLDVRCGAMHTGWGATADGDADNGQISRTANTLDAPIEIIERDAPVLVLRREYLPDSGGVGRHRGGASVLKDSLWLTEVESHSMANHVRSANGVGANGGVDSGAGGVWVWDAEAVAASCNAPFLPVEGEIYGSATVVTGVVDPRSGQIDNDGGQYFYCNRNNGWSFPAGSIWRYVPSGGGGWGNPLEREPAAVLRDVRDGYVSTAAALRDYAVAIGGDAADRPEGLTIDETATGCERASREHEQSVRRSVPYARFAAPLFVDREPVDGECASCGEQALSRHPALREDRWFIVVKCSECLTCAEAAPIALSERTSLADQVLRSWRVKA